MARIHLFRFQAQAPHQQVNNISRHAFEEVSTQPEVRFQMTSNGCDGRTSATALSLLVPLVSIVSFQRRCR